MPQMIDLCAILDKFIEKKSGYIFGEINKQRVFPQVQRYKTLRDILF